LLISTCEALQASSKDEGGPELVFRKILISIKTLSHGTGDLGCALSSAEFVDNLQASVHHVLPGFTHRSLSKNLSHKYSVPNFPDDAIC
jgi:hypothetical protein